MTLEKRSMAESVISLLIPKGESLPQLFMRQVSRTVMEPDEMR